MKKIYISAISAIFAGIDCSAQGINYTNFIRQVQYPTGVQWDATVASAGQQLSALRIDPGGARFELWTVKASPFASYSLDNTFVGTYIPIANVVVRSEDTASSVLRTRADRPFFVDVTISGLRSGTEDPAASKSVNFYHHAQAYGDSGTEVGIDRSLATLISQSSINVNGTTTTTYFNSIPSTDPLHKKVRGEEKFSVYSLADYQAPASVIASQTIQIWPTEEGEILGITENQVIKGSMPDVSLEFVDLYPGSTTSAQLYSGEQEAGKTGSVITSWTNTYPSSQNKSIPSLSNLDSLVTSDGKWTLELITETPFGIKVLDHVTFTKVSLSVIINASITTN
jgi:hypothetical protein